MNNLILDLSTCIQDKCRTLRIEDNSGIYDELNNEGGWSVAIVESLVSAVVTVLFNGEVLSTHNVLTTIPNPPEASYTLLLNTIDTYADGEYLIRLELTDNLGRVKTEEIMFYSVCNVRCCVDGLWGKAIKEVNNDCGCSGTNDNTKTALQSEALLGLIKNAASCLNSSSREAILKKLQRICKFEKCNCN